MKLSTKICLIVAASMVLLGGVTVGVGVMLEMMGNGEDFGMGMIESSYEITEEFSSVSVKTDTANVILAKSEDGTARVECKEEKNLFHRVAVRDGALTVELQDTRKWYEYIRFFSFGSPEIKVYLPKTLYEGLFVASSTGDVRVPAELCFGEIQVSLSTGDISLGASSAGLVRLTASTGSINVSQMNAQTMQLTTSTGDVTLSDVRCVGEVSVKVSTGDVRMENVRCKGVLSSGNTGSFTARNLIADKDISVTRSTGDVSLERCDAAGLTLRTGTGSVTGTLLSEKIFFAETDTGRREVPQCMTGGRCEIRTSTGDIRFQIVGE